MEAKVAKTLLEAYASVYERSEQIDEQIPGFTPSAFKDQKQYPAVYQGKKGMVSGDEGARGRGFRIDPEDYDRAVKQIELNKKSKPTSGRGAGRATFNQNNSYEPEGELVDETIRPERPYDGPKVKSGPPNEKPRLPSRDPRHGGGKPYPGKPSPNKKPELPRRDPSRGKPYPYGKPMMNREDVDVFDIVKGYLMSEYDLTEELALKVMLELEDEHRDAILEAPIHPAEAAFNKSTPEERAANTKKYGTPYRPIDTSRRSGDPTAPAWMRGGFKSRDEYNKLDQATKDLLN